MRHLPVGSLSPEEWSQESEGLTKREYFAAMAMGIERSQTDIEFHIRCAKNLNPHNTPGKPHIPSVTEVRAMLAAKDADALIVALNTPEDK